MTRRYWPIGLVTVIACLGSYAAGRWTAPTKTVEKVRTVEVERTAKAEQQSARTETRADVQTVERVVTRYVRIEPSGAREEREETRESGAQRAEEKRAEQVRTVVEERLVYRDREVLKVQDRTTAPPRWLLGASVQPSMSGVDGATVTGGVRLIGPAWLMLTGGRLDGRWVGTVGVGGTF